MDGSHSRRADAVSGKKAAILVAGVGMARILAPMLFLPLFERFRERLPGRRFLAARPWTEAISKHGAHLVASLDLMRSLPRSLALRAC